MMNGSKKSPSLTPALRFPGFDTFWERVLTNDIFSIFNGYGFSSSDAREEGCRWIKIADVGILQMRKENRSYLPSEYAIKYKKFLLKKGDFVVALTRPILNGSLKIAQIDDQHSNSLLNQRVGKIVTKNHPSFVYYILQRKGLVFQIDARISGTDPPNLAPSEIASIPLFVAALPEQRKIADFLTAVDERIAQLKQKKALLTQYKKGVMQQLFTQVIRFKDDHGNDFPDWEEKRLGDICELVNGLTYSPDDVAENGLLVLRSSNVQNGKVTLDDNVFVTNDVKDWNLSRPGDILICVRNGSKRLIGKSAMISEGCPKSTHGAFMTMLRGVSNGFLIHILQTDNYKRNVHRNLGATINSINGSDLKKFKFMLPASVEEEAKVASFLSNIDTKLENVSTQITETQTFKRGLLQQMFV